MAHRRRGVGVNRTNNAKIATQKKADEIKAASLQNALNTLEELEIKLSQFASIHTDDIHNDPIFRYKFFQMCSPLGIDPLCSSKKKDNNKKNLFGNLFHINSDYFYELSVKVAEVCLANRSKNGGIMSIYDVQQILANRKTKLGTTSANIVASSGSHHKQQQTDINVTDIQIAIEKLSILGGGFRTIEIGKTLMIVSVPTELDNDHITVMNIAAAEQHDIGGFTIPTIQQHCPNWTIQRIERAIQLLLQEGMIWLDIYHNTNYYWFTSIWRKEK